MKYIADSSKPMSISNLDRLITAARLLRPLLDELVFVGGSVAGLLITDEAAGELRPTLDVDAIAEITSYVEYATFGNRLRALDFAEDTTEEAPLCRWVNHETILDVMPLDEAILGFSNRWYFEAMQAATTRRVAADLEIRVISAPFFLATKLEAFKGRGEGDYLGSHDIEDLIAVIDGRATLLADVQSAPEILQQYISREIAGFLDDSKFLDAVPGHLLPDGVSQLRLGIVIERLKKLASY